MKNIIKLLNNQWIIAIISGGIFYLLGLLTNPVIYSLKEFNLINKQTNYISNANNATINMSIQNNSVFILFGLLIVLLVIYFLTIYFIDEN